MDETTLAEKVEYNANCRRQILEIEKDIAKIKLSMYALCKECMNDGFVSCDSCQDFNMFVEEPCE